jgi:hypothetical protein
LIAQVPVEVVLVHTPDRLARRYAWQALLLEPVRPCGHRGAVRQSAC